MTCRCPEPEVASRSGAAYCAKCGDGLPWAKGGRASHESRMTMKIEGAFVVTWVELAFNGHSVEYRSSRTGGYALRSAVEQLQEQAARIYRTIDLMRRADDIETVRAIATIAIGEP